MEKTGKSNCEETPYGEWDEASYGREEELGVYARSRIADTPELQSIARKEREFLESLLEES